MRMSTTTRTRATGCSADTQSDTFSSSPATGAPDTPSGASSPSGDPEPSGPAGPDGHSNPTSPAVGGSSGLSPGPAGSGAIAGISAPGTPVGTGQTAPDGTTYFTSTDGTTTYVTRVDPATRTATTKCVDGDARGAVRFGPDGSWYQVTIDTHGLYTVTAVRPDDHVNVWRGWPSDATPVGDLAFSDDGTVYQTIREIRAAPDGFDPNSTKVFVLGSAGAHLVKNIGGIAYDGVQVHDGHVLQVTYGTLTGRSTITDLPTGRQVTVDGRPHGALTFSGVEHVGYLVTTTDDGNSQLHQHDYRAEHGPVITTGLAGTPVGAAVADAVPGPAGGARVYVTTDHDGITIVNTVDAAGDKKVAFITGTALGAPQIAALEGGAEDGYLYQAVTTGASGRSLTLIERATHTVGRSISTNAPVGQAIFRNGNVYLLGSGGDGTRVVWFDPDTFWVSGAMNFTDIQLGVPQTSTGSVTPTLVSLADGTYYLTLLHHDPGTGRYTTNVVHYGDHLIGVTAIPGNHNGPPQHLRDGNIIQVVHADGTTRYVILQQHNSMPTTFGRNSLPQGHIAGAVPYFGRKFS